MNPRRKLGSARRGLGEWIGQRLSAVYLGGFGAYLASYLILHAPPDYPTWHAWVGGSLTRALFALAVLALLMHAWIGLRSVFLDYLKPLWLRAGVSIAAGAGLLLLGLWAGEILLWGWRA